MEPSFPRVDRLSSSRSVFGVIMIAQALAERRYALAGVAAAVLAVGLPIAARMKRLRASLRGDNDQARRL